MNSGWYRLTFLCLCSLTCGSMEQAVAQDGWSMEGGLRRWRGPEIVGGQIGCEPETGNPAVEFAATISEVDLVSGITSHHSKPTDGAWAYVPRNPHMMLKVERDVNNPTLTTVSFYNTWAGGLAQTVSLEANTTQLAPDEDDTWIAEDGSIGAIVFAPTSSTPTEAIEYVVAIFDKSGVRTLKHIKPKVDVDIYVRPDPDEGVLVYIRGNGLQISGYQDEVFTNASYLYINPEGAIKQLSLPERGPGSGKGRKIIWHSNRWDRLVFSDEYASGILIVKASNGIPTDTVEHLVAEPSKPLRIISASGNNNDRWMVTHAKSGDKNALVLWAMPDLHEVSTVDFATSDPAIKQLPLSPWSVLIPFLSVSQSGNALYAWDAQDVLSVYEHPHVQQAAASPLPASNHVRIQIEGWNGPVWYVVVSSMGQEVERGFGQADDGTLELDVVALPVGGYNVVIGQDVRDVGMHSAKNVATSTVIVVR